MQNWNLAAEQHDSVWIWGLFWVPPPLPPIKAGKGKLSEHLSCMSSAIRTLTMIRNACSYVRKVICVQLTMTFVILPNHHLEWKLKNTYLELSIHDHSWLHYGDYIFWMLERHIERQEIEMIRTARVQSINSSIWRKVFVLNHQCLLLFVRIQTLNSFRLEVWAITLEDSRGPDGEMFRHLCTAKSVQHLDTPGEARLFVSINISYKNIQAKTVL